jgi:hypothetical protein
MSGLRRDPVATAPGTDKITPEGVTLSGGAVDNRCSRT